MNTKLLLESFDSLVPLARSTLQQEQFHANRVNELQSQVSNLEESLSLLAKDFTLHTESAEVLRRAIELKSKSHLESLQGLVTLALRTIFPNRNYTFIIEVEEKRSANNAKFMLIEKFEDGTEVISSLAGEVGGSIRSVVGFTFQIFYINYFDLAPVIFMDESFTSLSEEYVPTLIQFLKQLTEQLGFIFIWISHDIRYGPYADRSYRVENHTVVEVSVQ